MAVTASDRSIPTGEGITFEKVWAMIQKTDRIVRENAWQMGYLNNRFGEMGNIWRLPVFTNGLTSCATILTLCRPATM